MGVMPLFLMIMIIAGFDSFTNPLVMMMMLMMMMVMVVVVVVVVVVKVDDNDIAS